MEGQKEAKEEAERDRPGLTIFTDGSRANSGTTGHAVVWKKGGRWASGKAHMLQPRGLCRRMRSVGESPGSGREKKDRTGGNYHIHRCAGRKARRARGNPVVPSS